VTVHIGVIDEGAKYYASLASEKASALYYADGGGLCVWTGGGRRWFGLEGEVRERQLVNLYAGKAPTGEDLGIKRGGQKRIHRAGYDISVDPPKPVSILRFLGPSEMRLALEQWHRESAELMFGFAEAELAWTRLGRGGHTKVRTRLVSPHVIHHLSRGNDMQVHSHFPIPNIARRPNGKFGTLDATHFYRNCFTLNALYMCHLSYRMEQDGGLAVARAVQVLKHPEGEVIRERPWFDVEGITPEAIDLFSKRRAQILADMKNRKVTGAREAAISALGTRRKKNRGVTARELLPLWLEAATRIGLTPAYLAQLFQKAPQRSIPLAVRIDQAITGAIATLSQTQAHFGKHELVRHAAENAIGQGIDARLLLATIEHRLEHAPDLLARGGPAYDRRYTTRANFEREQELLQAAQKLSERANHVVATETVERVLSQRKWRSLKEEQREAVRYIATGNAQGLPASLGSDLALVSGMAGTGKTTMLRCAQAVLNEAKLKVVGAAFTGKAAIELQKAGIHSSTIHGLLKDLEATPLDDWKHHGRQVLRAALGKPTYALTRKTIGRDTIVVVDECGMCPTELLLRLTRQVEARGAALVCVGDERQVQPIAAGGPFKSLMLRHGGVTLKDVTRQKLTWQVDAVQHFAEGNARQGLRLYQEHGCLTVKDDRAQVHEAMVQDWVQAGGLKRPAEHFMIAPTRASVYALNALAQAARIQAGKVKTQLKVRVNSQGLYLGVPKLQVGASTIYQGDRIMLTRNFHWKEFRRGKVHREWDVRNGDLATLHRIDHIKNTIEVTLDRDPSKRIVIPLAQFQRYGPALELGYAGTVMKSQGASIPHVQAKVGACDRELAYTAASRHVKSLHLYASTSDLGADGEELVRAMSRSHQKDLFHDVPDQTQELEIHP
jgi:conjugative relaxase-like TrwC/TraI family protein